MISIPGVHALLLLCFLFAPWVFGNVVNRTIDDQYGDPVTGFQVQYSPVGEWTQGNNCDFCAAKPSNLSAFNGTWHDITWLPDRTVEPLILTLRFNGTAIYVFNIGAKSTFTNVNFTLDGSPIGNYTNFFNGSDQFVYNVSVLSHENIPYGEHTLNMQASPGSNATLILFDYAIYTTNTTSVESSTPNPTNASSSSSRKTNTGAIAGGVVGGVILLIALVFGGLFYARRRASTRITDTRVSEEKDTKVEPHITPFISTPRRGPVATSRSSSPAPPVLLSEKRSLTTGGNDGQSLTPDPPSSVEPDSASLHEQISILRAELEALRNRGAASSQAPPSSAETRSSRDKEIAILREQVAQLRANQTQEQTPSPPSSATLNEGLLRELSSLRAELEQMRMQQEVSQYGELPRYTPRSPG